ncbi:hypothetical protein D9615_007458 [Tricholomella constricta]|uniref:RNA polymerase-associated protein LEO1 n=1 Tax=Tricholomella constricta TaxID=117010 RepID=A0A8H5LX40_9AGAR|nr:hypothetical protein D9615_007458 [Tricholomella constricta]
MSSLAGALDDTYVPKVEDDVKYPPVAEQDVEMADAGDQAELQEDDEEMDDLFGNDEVEDAKQQQSASSPSASVPDSERLPSPERERRQALEYEEEEIPPEIAVEVKEAEVSFPNLPVPKGSDGSNWVIRMPNFVKVDSKPFHPDTYMGPEHEDEESQLAENMRERSMSIKLKVENTVRWRWMKDEVGVERRQSNSRIIRWSDGTLSLRLGKELFDINQSLDTSAGIPRQLIGSLSSQPQPASQPDGPIKSQGLTYLVAQHKRSQVLQAEAIITGHMSLRPTDMQSETHRMLVRAVGQKHNKVARLRMAPDPTMDPEREKMELMKQSAKKSKKRNDFDDILGSGRKRRYSRKTANHDVWSDDDDDVVGAFEGSDEEDDVTGVGSSGRKSKRKDDDRKGPEDYQEDDFVVADSSEEDAPQSGKKRKSGDDEEEDPLDKLDAKIREQQDAQKRRRESDSKVDDDESGGDSEKGADMDVESEEEEDEGEFKVRRSGTGSRKRAVVLQDDEDEE